ncbi:Abhydrolase_5 domain-containing protein, partial [Cephalotus follicularis]
RRPTSLFIFCCIVLGCCNFGRSSCTNGRKVSYPSALRTTRISGILWWQSGSEGHPGPEVQNEIFFVMIEQFINFVIRPPRAEYNPDQYLWERDFTLAGKTYKRQDLELRNARGQTLQCSHYVPSPFPQDTPLPCVIYCHGNSGCRADANEAAVILLPSNITVFTLDFSGSGLSEGDYVSLGWHERDDLKIAVSYLRSNKQISCIGLWGRSMGAVTSLLYGAEDPSIAGIVLDSAFSNLFDLMMELVDVYKIRLPKFTVKMALQYMRRVIQKKAKFDIMALNCLKVAPKSFIPALFGHARDDKFIQPHHSDLIFKSYAGDKNIIKFDGEHNTSRPQFYYDSVSIFFYNVLHPPQISSGHSSKLEKYYDLGELKIGADMDESLLYEIISGLRSARTDATSSSSAPSILTTKPMDELLSEVPVTDEVDLELNGDSIHNSDEHSHLQDKPNGEGEECCSYTSSNRESWGRCSSLEGSDEESSADCTATNSDHQMTIQVLATPARSIRRKWPTLSTEEKEKNKAPIAPKKSRHEKLVKLEALGKRLRLCILGRVNHRRYSSS